MGWREFLFGWDERGRTPSRSEAVVGQNEARMHRQLGSIEDAAKSFGVFLLICILVFGLARGNIAAALPRDAGAPAFLFTVSMLLGVAAASAVIGGILGFLFGIPKLLQEKQIVTDVGAPAAPGIAGAASIPAALPANQARLFAGNTNLEEISDWLTKIIVGVGLVQATAIYREAVALADKFQTHAMGGASGSSAIFAGISIAALGGGFLVAYLETRTRITLLLLSSEQAGDLSEGRQALNSTIINKDDKTMLAGHSPAEGAKRAGVEPIATQDDLKIISLPFAELDTKSKLIGWGTAQFRAKNFDKAAHAYLSAIDKDPTDAALRLALAEAKMQLPDKRGADQVMTRAREDFSTNPSVLENKIYTSLYLDSPASFREALDSYARLEQLAPDRIKKAHIQLWKAAALGQKYKWLRDNLSTTPSNGEEMGKVKAEALATVQKIVEAERNNNSGVHQSLRRIYDPKREKSPADENDLEVFKGDAEFDELIYGPSVRSAAN